MKLENYEVHLPSYSIGSTIYNKIGPVCESYGRTVLVIGGEKALAATYEKIAAAVAETRLTIIGKELFGTDCTYDNVERLRALPVYQQADMVFGVGGGKSRHGKTECAYSVNGSKRRGQPIPDTSHLRSYNTGCRVHRGEYGSRNGRKNLQ